MTYPITREDIQLDAFSMNGEYFLSQSQVAEAVDRDEKLFRTFLRSEQVKPLFSNGFSFGQVEVDRKTRRGHSTAINVIPINIASAFWLHQTVKGNVKAQALMYACTIETLERRCDKAFQRVNERIRFIEVTK